MKTTHSSKAPPRGLASRTHGYAQVSPSLPLWPSPIVIPRYLLPGEQDVGQVLANLR